MTRHRSICHSLRAASVHTTSLPLRRCLSSAAPWDSIHQPVQSYISMSNDPYLNLSIEHHLLQNSSPNSAILFLYINRPSIIIGRNQNPWLEVNLALLHLRAATEAEPPGLGTIDLVRRRSGGGTVFHDEGNVNWTVICPAADFTRDKHAEMVVRALRGRGIDRARVNARHDIVLDQGQAGAATDPEDTHTTPYEATDFDTPRPLKVSGSAYKLTWQRALHHGTCLLNSPNLNVIPHFLHSPAKPFMTARGVESVSSPVGNILLESDDFIASVQGEFAQQYGTGQKPAKLGEEWLEDNNVRKGYDELRSPDWTYLQTPQFSLATKSDESISEVDLDLTVRSGAISSGSLIRSGSKHELSPELLGRKVHEIESWSAIVESNFHRLNQTERSNLTGWLAKMLPRVL